MTEHAPGFGLLANVGIPLGELVDFGRECEAAGCASVWMVEYEYDALAITQAIAASTSRVLTGTCISRAFTRHPISMAESAAVIDRLAPGRFVIGLGTGALKAADPLLSMQRWGQEWDKPVGRMREYVQVVREAMTGEKVSYDGQFFQLSNIRIDPAPSTYVPIYIAAGGERMSEVAGAEADGVFVHLVNREMTERTRRAVDRGARGAGRDPSQVELSNLIMVCLDDERDVAYDAMRHWLVDFYLNMPSYQRVLERGGYADTAEAVRTSLAAGDPAGAEAALPDELLEEFTMVGTPADCERKLAEIVSWGTSMPILYPFPSRHDWLDGYQRTLAALAGAGRSDGAIPAGSHND
jgi:5,10-methylenetetrahydromethanopterin reductase